MTHSPPPFLVDCIPHDPSPSRPHITLTWAQSLDAKIAGGGGRRVMLSGPESMMMTHWMRSMHDVIMVGINTIVMDDPRLQINLLPSRPDLLPPQPIILDPQLKFPIKSRILQVYNEWKIKVRSIQEDDKSSTVGMVRQPWLLCGDEVPQARRTEVEVAGARVISVPLVDGRVPPSSLPAILASLSMRSIMIEGGSRVLSSFLHAPARDDGTPLVDMVIVTVAPMFIGKGIGIVPEDEGDHLPQLETIHTEVMGKDAVMVCRIAQR